MAFTTGATCPNCGAMLDSDSVFCTECGTNVSSIGATVVSGGSARRCVSCNAPLDDDAMFCTECGTPLAGSAGTTAPMTPSGRTCPSCGASVDDDAVFCTECGMSTLPTMRPTSYGGPTCAVCGEPLDDDAAFCVKCGTRVGTGGTETAVRPMTNTEMPPITPITPMPTEPPRIFDGNDDDPEADKTMKRHFHSAGGLD